MSEGELKKRIKSKEWEDENHPFHILQDEAIALIDEAKKDFVKQSISLKDAVTVLADVDQTRIICFPVEVFLNWFGEPE